MEVAIKPVKELNAILDCPKSKGFTNRAILVASLASGTSKLRNALDSEDTQVMIGAAKKFGAQITRQDGSLKVIGNFGAVKSAKKIMCENSGTTIRFCSAVAALSDGVTILDGNQRMRQRPIGELAEALVALGAKAKTSKGCPPITVKGPLLGGKANLKGEESSQYASAILMASPYAKKEVEISIEGELTSKPYVDMTIAVMKSFCADAYCEDYKKLKIPSGSYKCADYFIEGDFANASYFFAAAAITKGQVKVTGINPKTIQGESKFLDALEQMGCTIKKSQDSIAVEGGDLKGIDIDMNSMPDVVQTLAVVAAFAKGKTTIRNVRNLRIKETDRLSALSTELRKMGAKVDEKEDGLKITPAKLRNAAIETYNDHRMAMSFAIAGLVVPKITIKGAQCVEKTFPDFFKELDKICN